MDVRVKVGVLGATGTVGQRLLQQLDGHPSFILIKLGASDQSAGQSYSSITRTKWLLDTPIPEEYGRMIVVRCIPEEFRDCKIVFSALSSGVAGVVERQFAEAGLFVFSNAKDHREDVDVPVLVPAVNPEHMHLVKTQSTYPHGFIVTKANCSTAGLVIGLAPLQAKYGIEKLFVATLQALSGAGYPGVPSLDIQDNVIPYIADEEEKLMREPCKIFNTEIQIHAHCNRVQVSDGHTICVSVTLRAETTLQEVVDTLKTNAPYRELQERYPKTFNYESLLVIEDRPPQPRLDRNRGNGLTTTIGRIRGSQKDYHFVLVSHNTLIGAASAALKAAEFSLESGFISFS